MLPGAQLGGGTWDAARLAETRAWGPSTLPSPSVEAIFHSAEVAEVQRTRARLLSWEMGRETLSGTEMAAHIEVSQIHLGLVDFKGAVAFQGMWLFQGWRC